HVFQKTYRQSSNRYSQQCLHQLLLQNPLQIKFPAESSDQNAWYNYRLSQQFYSLNNYRHKPGEPHFLPLVYSSRFRLRYMKYFPEAHLSDKLMKVLTATDFLSLPKPNRCYPLKKRIFLQIVSVIKSK